MSVGRSSCFFQHQIPVTVAKYYYYFFYQQQSLYWQYLGSKSAIVCLAFDEIVNYLFLSSACRRACLLLLALGETHFKSQSKQSCNNSCCLDIFSPLRKLERICVSSVISRPDCDRNNHKRFQYFPV